MFRGLHRMHLGPSRTRNQSFAGCFNEMPKGSLFPFLFLLGGLLDFEKLPCMREHRANIITRIHPDDDQVKCQHMSFQQGTRSCLSRGECSASCEGQMVRKREAGLKMRRARCGRFGGSSDFGRKAYQIQARLQSHASEKHRGVLFLNPLLICSRSFSAQAVPRDPSREKKRNEGRAWGQFCWEILS